MAASTNFTGLAVCRWFLGVFEAGFFPGVIYYMSLWYTRREYGRRVGFFWSFASLAGVFGGLIAYGISQIPTNTLKTWQLLFIIEGIPSVLLAAFSAWYLPNQPETAKFLTTQQREFAVKRLAIGKYSKSLFCIPLLCKPTTIFFLSHRRRCF
jgi:MFS family permease